MGSIKATRTGASGLFDTGTAATAVVIACAQAHNPLIIAYSKMTFTHFPDIIFSMSSSLPASAPALSVLSEAAQQSYPASALYVLATPIGNVCDISLRALHVLTIADAVACEDTRNTSHLLSRYGISQHLIAAHEHNEHEAAEKIIVRLQQGERIALVSDAGTPAVSDPGARIVAAVRAAGLRVVPLPGASAAVTALSASGLLNDRFHFIGFLPNKGKQRELALHKLTHDSATMVFYEAPHRIVETVDALLLAFGPERQIVLARELTKLFETVHHCPLAEAPHWLHKLPAKRKTRSMSALCRFGIIPIHDARACREC